MHSRAAASGQIIPITAILLIAIVGMAAFVIDSSNLYSQHRRMQADMDVAARVVASRLFDTVPSDPGYVAAVESAIGSGAQMLTSDGYPTTVTYSPIGGNTANGICGIDATEGVSFCTPPQTGLYAGAKRYDMAEGIITQTIPGLFGHVMGLGELTITARAVAWHGGFVQPYAMIGLDQNSGNCAVSVQDESSSLALNGSLLGNGQTCNKGTATVQGHADAGNPTSGSNGSPIIGQDGTNVGVAPAVDPYPTITMTVPTSPAIVVCASGCSTSTFSGVNGTCPGWVQANLNITTPQPGSYYYFPPADGGPALVSNFSASGSSYYFLPHCDGTPAEYYFVGSPNDIKLAGTPSINSINSVFILDNTSGSLIQQSGQARLVLNAPTSGTFNGIALYEARPCTPTTSLTINGDANSLINGVLDVPCTAITISGNSSDNPFVNGGIVAYDITIAGHGTTYINYDPSALPPDEGSVLVE